MGPKWGVFGSIHLVGVELALGLDLSFAIVIGIVCCYCMFACCILHVACCFLGVACCLLHIAYNMLLIVFWLLLVTIAVTIAVGTYACKLIGYITRLNMAGNYSLHRLTP